MKLKKLEAKNISKSFNGNFLFKDLSIDLTIGDFMLINGDNGVGKSTLIKVLLGLIKSDSGLQNYLLNNSFKSSSGYISSNLNSFFNRLTVEQNLNFFLNMRGFKSAVVLHEIMDELSINKNLLKKDYMYLSSGERKKVSILRALSHKPSILFMDEPFNYLDARFKSNLLDYISNRIRSNKLLIVAASHEIDLFEGIYNHNLRLGPKGKHFEQGIFK